MKLKDIHTPVIRISSAIADLAALRDLYILPSSYNIPVFQYCRIAMIAVLINSAVLIVFSSVVRPETRARIVSFGIYDVVNLVMVFFATVSFSAHGEVCEGHNSCLPFNLSVVGLYLSLFSKVNCVIGEDIANFRTLQLPPPPAYSAVSESGDVNESEVSNADTNLDLTEKGS